MFLRVKHRKLLKQMKELEVSEKALNTYRTIAKDSIKDDKEKLIKKLKRNFILAEQHDKYSKRFGNLYISYEGNVIKSVYNVKGRHLPCNIDFELRDELNKVLGI